MPDDPLGKPGPDSEEELEQRFDEIEHEEMLKSFESASAPDDEDNADDHRADWPLPDNTTVEELLRLNKLEEALKQSASNRQSATSSIEEEFQVRADALAQKFDRAMEARNTRESAERKRLASDAELGRGAGFGLTIAYTIMGLPMVGAAGGWLLDQRLGTQIWVGILTLTGAILGIFSAIMMLQRGGSNG